MARVATGIPTLRVAPNLDPALHLETEKPPGRIDDKKVQFVFDNGIGALSWQDDAPGVEDGPVAWQVALENGEDLPLGIRGVSVGMSRKHLGHGSVIPLKIRFSPSVLASTTNLYRTDGLMPNSSMLACGFGSTESPVAHDEQTFPASSWAHLLNQPGDRLGFFGVGTA